MSEKYRTIDNVFGILNKNTLKFSILKDHFCINNQQIDNN